MYVMRYVVVIKLWPKSINKFRLSFTITTLRVDNQGEIFTKELTSGVDSG